MQETDEDIGSVDVASTPGWDMQALKRLLDDHQEHIERVVCRTTTESMADAAVVYFPPPPAAPAQGQLLPVADVSVHPSRLRDLRAFLCNPSAQWSTPLQGVMLEKILSGRQNLLAVLATGTGKTTTIMMMAKMYAPTQTILVVLPLMALHDDFHRRAQNAGLVTAQFSLNNEFQHHANIVTVPVECLPNVQFHQYVAPVCCLLSLLTDAV